MHAKHPACARQQRRARRHDRYSNPYTFLHLLTGPELRDEVDALVPEHRERLFPPTETRSMFLAQALHTDRSCQTAVKDTAEQHWSGGLPQCRTHTGDYGRARQRLPVDLVSTLTQKPGRGSRSSGW
jgi:hypothetical protein